MKASEMTNEELAECIESARLAPAKYVREDDLNFHSEAIREAAARLRNLGKIGEEVGLEATREKSSRVGNAAKMRNALKETQSVIEKCMEILNRIPGGVPYDGLIDDVADEICDLRDSHVKPALSAPPRNCDIGNALEQVSRHRIWCKCGGDCAVSCKMCFAKWSQMPYEEGGAK